VSVLLIEDQPIIVAGLIASLEAAGGIKVVGQVPDAAGARAVLAKRRVDVILLDLHLPGGAAGDFLLERRRESSGASVLVLSPFESSHCLSASIKLGAAGFVLTTSPVETIVRAIRAIRSGARAFSASQLRAASGVRWTPLSSREHQIVAGLIRGRSNDELSADVGVSRKTVELHLSRLFERFSVLSRTELAVHVEREHILSLPVVEPARQSSGETASRNLADAGDHVAMATD
jgi:DNA-binding NarL/FixJ family response regulator